MLGDAGRLHVPDPCNPGHLIRQVSEIDRARFTIIINK